MKHINIAEAGHKYRYAGLDVMAMETGESVYVQEIVQGDPWHQLGSPELVHISQLKPLPMSYFDGQIPSD